MTHSLSDRRIVFQSPVNQTCFWNVRGNQSTWRTWRALHTGRPGPRFEPLTSELWDSCTNQSSPSSLVKIWPESTLKTCETETSLRDLCEKYWKAGYIWFSFSTTDVNFMFFFSLFAWMLKYLFPYCTARIKKKKWRRPHAITNNRMWQSNTLCGSLIWAPNQHTNILKCLISSQFSFFLFFFFLMQLLSFRSGGLCRFNTLHPYVESHKVSVGGLWGTN